MMNQYWYPLNNMIGYGFNSWWVWLFVCMGFIFCFVIIAALIVYIIGKK